MKYDTLKSIFTGRTGIMADGEMIPPCSKVPAGVVIELPSDDVRVSVWKRKGAIKPHVEKEAPKVTGKVTKRGRGK